jgi:sugar phosphate isomerase/epimerase
VTNPLRTSPPVAGRPAEIGIDTFSFHRFFGEANEWEQPLSDRWSYADALAETARLGVRIVSLQTVHVPHSEGWPLARLSQLLAEHGLTCVLSWGHRNGLADGESREALESAVDALAAARAIGSPLARIVCGDQRSWSADPETRRRRSQRLRPCLDRVAETAETLGIDVAVENHADFVMEDLVDLLGAVGSRRIGICFDAGNAARVGDDPVRAAQLAAPRVLMSHLRDLRIQQASVGDPAAWWPCVPLGKGDLDVPAILAALTGAPRCRAWFVEVSNLAPGYTELGVVEESLAYLRTAIADGGPRAPAAGGH